MNNDGVLLNGKVIKLKAEKLLEETNLNVRDEDKISMKFSKGWMERFKKRHNLRFRRVQGEAHSADTAAIREWMPRIIRIIMTYSYKDVWNADDFRLFYTQPPSWTLASGAVSGCKKRDFLKFLACCNNDGSKKCR